MKRIPLTRRNLLAVIFLTIAAPAAADRPPNVVLLLTDDQGYADLGCYGATDLKTPHVDALAARGVRFAQFYSAAPVCSPSRAGTLTGKVPQRAGVPGNVSSTRGEAGMPAWQRTIAEVFRAAGYATGHVGKWHLGYTPETMPNGQGFDFSFGHMGGCIDNYSHFFYWQGPNRHDLWRDGEEVYRDGRYFPDLMAEEAAGFAERNRDRPFFLYWAINAPHYPYQGEDRWRKEYAALPPPRREYAAFVSTIDERIGRLTSKLEELGLTDDTIVVFQSDHGFSTEERAFFGGGSAGPYRGAKFSLFEGGLRVPAIVSWPKRLPEGAVRGQFGVACDWLPTLADLAGVEKPAGLDGRSLAAVLRNDAASPHPTFHWQTGPEKNPQWAVRDGDWKLLGNPKDTSRGDAAAADGTYFLANLAEDPAEATNLSSARPDVVTRLQALHDDWAASLRSEPESGPRAPSPFLKPRTRSDDDDRKIR